MAVMAKCSGLERLEFGIAVITFERKELLGRCNSFVFSTIGYYVILSGYSPCRLNCLALGTCAIWKIESLAGENTNRKTYSSRAREQNSFPDIAYSAEISTSAD